MKKMKKLRIDERAYNALIKRKKAGESLSQTIIRLVREYNDYFGAFPGLEPFDKDKDRFHFKYE